MDKQKITLDILTERPVIRNDIPSELDIVIEVRSEQEDSEVRTTKALNLCVVIDRSGSMRGEKLNIAKKSCIDIFKRLGEDDLLTIVVFDDEAEVIVNPSVPRDEIPAKINAIQTGGTTNLSLGWYLGLLELQTHGTEHHYNRLILLSDGQANQGETKPTILAQEAVTAREKGITTSTIGIGNDFQEDILQTIALQSGGYFWYIQESRMEHIIQTEFQGALSVIVDRPRVEFSIPDGVKIAKELNTVSKLTGRYLIRPITGQYTFNFALRLAINPEDIDETLALSSILYDGDEKITSKQIELKLTPLEDYVKSGENLVVTSVVQQYQSAVSGEEMIEKIDAGDFSFVNEMLIEEIGGMRRAINKMQQDENGGIWDRELDMTQTYLADKEITYSITKTFDTVLDLDLHDTKFGIKLENLARYLRKHLMRDVHKRLNRIYDKKYSANTEKDYVGFLQATLLVLDEAIDEFPDRVKLHEARKYVCEQLEKHQ